MRSLLVLVFLLSNVGALGSACSHATPRPEPAAAAPAGADGAPAGPAASEAAQPVPRFERVDIGTTGMAAYLPRGFPAFAAEPSDDGSLVHTAELVVGDFHFACIALRFKEPIQADDDLEALLEGYLDFLQKQFNITGSAGYGRGHRLDDAPQARGVIDFWQDGDGDEWAIKGWVTPTHLAVMMIYGRGEYPHYNVKQMYFDGVRFPAR